MKNGHILHDSNFQKLFFAGLTSEFGSFLTETALMLYVYDLSGKTKAYLGITRAVFLFSLTCGNLIGGVFGDRLNRKNVLITSLVVRAPLVLTLVLSTNIFVLIFVLGLVAFFTGFYTPSRHAIVNDIVPQVKITQANAQFSTAFAIIHMIGPFLGAFVYGFSRSIHHIVVFDFFTYLIGIAAIMRIDYKMPSNLFEKSKSFSRELLEGLAYIKKRVDLSSLMINNSILGLCIGVLLPLLLPFVEEVLHKDKTIYGICWTLFGLGGIIGGQLSPYIRTFFRSGKIIVVSILLEPCIMLTWIHLENIYLNLFVFFLWGINVFIRIPSELNFIAETVETKFLTRVHSVLDLTFVIPSIVAGMIVALIGDRLSTYEILLGTSLVFIILTLPSFLFLKGMKALYDSNLKIVSRENSPLD